MYSLRRFIWLVGLFIPVFRLSLSDMYLITCFNFMSVARVGIEPGRVVLNIRLVR